MLEGAKATTETVAALRTGAAAMQAMQKDTYVALLIFKKICEFVLDILIYIYFICMLVYTWCSSSKKVYTWCDKAWLLLLLVYLLVFKPEFFLNIFLMWKIFFMYVAFFV